MPEPGRMQVFYGIHVFVREEDIGKLMMRYSHCLSFRDRHNGVAHFVSLNNSNPFRPGEL
jgi:hypothetical protein